MVPSRMCLGLRFALVEIKVAMVKTLREFSVVRTQNTPEKIELLPEGFTTMSKDPLLVKMVRRNI